MKNVIDIPSALDCRTLNNGHPQGKAIYIKEQVKDTSELLTKSLKRILTDFPINPYNVKNWIRRSR